MIIVVLLEVALSLSGVCSSPAGVIYAAAPEGRGAFHVGGRGTYNYGYNTGDGIAKVETRQPDGTVTGSYRYFDPLGRQIVRTYIADKRGFRVLGNELPIAPDNPAVGILNAQILTGPVEGTQEFGTLHLNDNKLALRSAHNVGYLQLPQNLQTVEVSEEPVLKVQNVHGGYISNSFGDTPYFYADDNFNYDFPAGFAYNSPVVYYRLIHPIGVKGKDAPSLVTAGHTKHKTHVYTSSAPVRKHRPIYRKEKHRPRFPYRRPSIRPFILGHS